MKFIIALLFPFLSFSQPKLSKMTLLDGNVEFMAPEKLFKMTNEMWRLKYHDFTRPMIVLTDEDAEVNLLVDLTKQKLNETQISEYKTMRVNNLKKSRPDFELLDEGIKTVDNKKVDFLKFLSQAVDQKIFNYYFFLVVDGKVLLFTFNCIEKLRPNWEKTADEVLLSVRAK